MIKSYKRPILHEEKSSRWHKRKENLLLECLLPLKTISDVETRHAMSTVCNSFHETTKNTHTHTHDRESDKCFKLQLLTTNFLINSPIYQVTNYRERLTECTKSCKSCWSNLPKCWKCCSSVELHSQLWNTESIGGRLRRCTTQIIR